VAELDLTPWDSDALFAPLLAEIRRLRIERDQFEEAMAMACQSPDPACDCPGCMLADSWIAAAMAAR
jgi:hypothetical protein